MNNMIFKIFLHFKLKCKNDDFLESTKSTFLKIVFLKINYNQNKK